MMASSSELGGLECTTQSYSMLLKSFGDHNNSNDQSTHKLEEYLNRLEEERLKIDAFKRELPLCMQLLSNAMEASRQQLQTYKATQGTIRPVLEEFIPLKNSNNIEGSNQKQANISDKANWMTSAQLWSQTSDGKPQQTSSTLPKSEDDHINFNNVRPNNLGLETKQRNGGAFLPFSKDRNSTPKNVTNMRVLPDLALSSSEEEKKNNDSENGINNGLMSCDNSTQGGNGVTNGNKSTDGQATATNTTTNNNNNQAHRKARRCWSPDLHRRFVNALQMLGGSQVATPKQIRELMKVDGLTNDEVKSHLQKYRLHTRRPSPSPQTAGGQTPQLVVLGGIWVPPEYAAATGGATMYSTHPTSQVSPHYCSSMVPQDFYPAPPQLPPPLHQHHQNHHQQLHVYKTSSHTQAHSSPESDTQGAGDRSESIEDGKSESSS
ncbi:hypothetical protein KSS87_003276 [Heliosperma pusillum]|nr:hypothetical protein KSS87_003276 [Heliosperma pusillum]